MTTINPLYIYCFTYFLSEEEINNYKKCVSEVIAYLKTIAKKWVFQLEQGELTERIHFQGKMNLITKQRLQSLINVLSKSPLKGSHLTPSTTKMKDSEFYEEKILTRIDGPWNNKDNSVKIARQIEEFMEFDLYPYQRTIKDSADLWDKRSINLIVQPAGNVGKSTASLAFEATDKRFLRLPAVVDAKDFTRMVYNCFDQNDKIRVIIIDLPKGFDQKKLRSLFMCIEECKNGYAYDDRYEFKKRTFDCPNIWVFTNSITEDTIRLLSADRWKIWGITNDTLELIPYNCFNKRLLFRNTDAELMDNLIRSTFRPMPVSLEELKRAQLLHDSFPTE